MLRSKRPIRRKYNTFTTPIRLDYIDTREPILRPAGNQRDTASTKKRVYKVRRSPVVDMSSIAAAQETGQLYWVNSPIRRQATRSVYLAAKARSDILYVPMMTGRDFTYCGAIPLSQFGVLN